MLIESAARADQWLEPETTQYFSKTGEFRLTVEPRKYRSPLEYFEAKVAEQVLPGEQGPTGTLEQLIDNRWHLLWSRKLVNEVAPVDAMVGDDGMHVVTFDNWHMMGHGDNVVVIYGENGSLKASLALDQIVPPYFVDGFSRTASSIHWRSGEPTFNESILELHLISDYGVQLSDAGQGSKAEGYKFSVLIELGGARVISISDHEMARLKPIFCAEHLSAVAEYNADIAFERNDLVAPDADDKDDWAWRRYAHHAIKRLKPVGNSGAGQIWYDELDYELLRPGEYMERDFRRDFRIGLTEYDREYPRRWFFSRDQKRMTDEIEKAAKKIKPGKLAGMDFRFLANNAHWPKILSAMSASGATLTQIDTAKPIPQTAENLQALPPDRTVDAACF